MTDLTPDDVADHIETVLNTSAGLWDHDGDIDVTTELTAGNQVTLTLIIDGREQRFIVTIEATELTPVASTRKPSQYTTPEDAAELGRGARRVMDQFRDTFGGVS